MTSFKKTRHERLVSINSSVVRNINRAAILNVIRENQPISRAKIAGLTRLNKSTVSSIVADLLDEDLVGEEASCIQTVGRSPIDLRLKTGKHLVGAIYFDSAKTAIAVVDIDGSLKLGEEIKTEPNQPEPFVARCLKGLQSLRNQFHLPALMGVGVAVAGIVDSAQAKVVFAPNLGWEDLDLGKIIATHCPDAGSITVENDAKASALAELWFGKHKTNPVNFVFLYVDRGIGTGIVVDRRVLNGNSHAAGEFGHMIVVEGGEICSCGNQGCWEAYASDRATIRRYLGATEAHDGGSSDMVISDIVKSARNGDVAARDALRETARYLGFGIANIIKAVDPEAIVIGGQITQIWDLIYPGIIETVHRRGFFGKQRNIAILPTSLSNSPPLLGAAALSIRRIFTDFRIAL
jgi:N-acetylglucosamine repressor